MVAVALVAPQVVVQGELLEAARVVVLAPGRAEVREEAPAAAQEAVVELVQVVAQLVVAPAVILAVDRVVVPVAALAVAPEAVPVAALSADRAAAQEVVAALVPVAARVRLADLAAPWVVAQGVGLVVALATPQSAVLPVVDQPAGGLPVSLVARVVVPLAAQQAESLAVDQVAAQEAVVADRAVALVAAVVLVAAVEVVRAEARRADRAARPVVDPLVTLTRGRKA